MKIEPNPKSQIKDAKKYLLKKKRQHKFKQRIILDMSSFLLSSLIFLSVVTLAQKLFSGFASDSDFSGPNTSVFLKRHCDRDTANNQRVSVVLHQSNTEL